AVSFLFPVGRAGGVSPPWGARRRSHGGLTPPLASASIFPNFRVGRRRPRYYNQPLRPGSTQWRPTCETADMIAIETVALDPTLPRAAAHFYFAAGAAVLAVALFFKFNRLLSVRNLD